MFISVYLLLNSCCRLNNGVFDGIFFPFWKCRTNICSCVWTLSKLHKHRHTQCFIEWREHYDMEPKSEWNATKEQWYADTTIFISVAPNSPVFLCSLLCWDISSHAIAVYRLFFSKPSPFFFYCARLMAASKFFCIYNTSLKFVSPGI